MPSDTLVWVGIAFEMTFKLFSRFYSTVGVPRVCIVGAGPAGYYAAMHITKKLPAVEIDMLEKLPVPFGLIRYGIAPDHPEVKNVINQFTKVATQNNVNFYGNVALGEEVNLEQLRQNYDAVLLTYGAEEDKLFGLQNEDHENVIAARKFVGWYNGLPSERNLKIDLSGRTAAILGQGNVALDVARILLSPLDELRKTDITEHALAAISQSQIKEVYLIGRRGPLQVAFTIKELREQLKLKNCKTVWRESDFVGVQEAAASVARPRKRLTELMLKSFSEMKAEDQSEGLKFFKPIFFRSPKEFLVQNGKLTGIKLTCNKLVGNSLENMKCVSTDEIETINCDLAIRSIGYKSISADKSLVIGPYGCVSNENGRVIDVENNTELCALYVAGWLGTGPVGVILHTMGNAFQVAKVICQDLEKLPAPSGKGGFENIRKYINKPIVDWNGWEKINNYEIEKGKSLGKPREKVCDVEEMLNIACK